MDQLNIIWGTVTVREKKGADRYIPNGNNKPNEAKDSTKGKEKARKEN